MHLSPDCIPNMAVVSMYTLLIFYNVSNFSDPQTTSLEAPPVLKPVSSYIIRGVLPYLGMAGRFRGDDPRF